MVNSYTNKLEQDMGPRHLSNHQAPAPPRTHAHARTHTHAHAHTAPPRAGGLPRAATPGAVARAAWAVLNGLHDDYTVTCPTASTGPTRSPFTKMQITLKSKSLCPEVPEMKTKTSFHCESPTKVTSRDIRVRTQVIPRHSGSPHFPQAALAGTAGCRIQHRVASALTASRGRPCSQEPRGMGRGRQPAVGHPPAHRAENRL